MAKKARARTIAYEVLLVVVNVLAMAAIAYLYLHRPTSGGLICPGMQASLSNISSGCVAASLTQHMDPTLRLVMATFVVLVGAVDIVILTLFGAKHFGRAKAEADKLTPEQANRASLIRILWLLLAGFLAIFITLTVIGTI